MHNNESRLGEFLAEAIVLYVEDEKEVRDLATKYLGRSIPNLFVAGNGEEALKLMHDKEIDILITDIMMDTIDGVELATRIKAKNPSCYIIFSTAYSDTDRLMQAVDIKVDKYLVKPVDWRELVKTVSSYAEQAFMMKHFNDDTQDEDTGVASSDLFKVIVAAIEHIDNAMDIMSNESMSETSIKAVRSLEESRNILEEGLKKHF